MATTKTEPTQADAYHEQFAARIIKALEAGTAPWQKPWWPGERILPHNFASGRDYRGGNAVYLAMTGLDHGYADPRWGGYRQIQEAGGHVRKGEKGTPIMYVEWRQRRTARDEQGQPVHDAEGRPQLEWVQRDRPIVKLHYVFNVEQTESLQLRSLQTAPPAWEGHERAEAMIRQSGIRVDHVAGDQACYRPAEDRVVLPERSQFPPQDAYTHTAPAAAPSVNVTPLYLASSKPTALSTCSRSRAKRSARWRTSCPTLRNSPQMASGLTVQAAAPSFQRGAVCDP